MNGNIENAKLEQAQILQICKDLDSQLSFFSRVYSDMGTWGNRAYVGEKASEEMAILVRGIYSLIETTRVICGDIGDYCYEAEKNNNNILIDDV